MHNVNLYSSFWELLPLKGLGPIRFLMDKSAVEAYHGELGSITAERNESLDQQQQNLYDTFNQLSEYFSEEDLKNALEALQVVGNSRDDISRTFMESGISLEYKANKLVEIFANDRAERLHFQGVPFFASNPKDLVMYVSKQLNETPCIKGEEVAFPGHNLFLFSFLSEQAGGAYREGEKRDRTVSWRNTARVNGTDLSDYRPLELV